MVFEIKGSEPLDARLNVRLPRRELEIIREDADMANISVSEIVRARYFGNPIIANADAVMIKELRRLGGLLKSVHVESHGAYSADTSSMLRQVSDYITKISTKK